MSRDLVGPCLKQSLAGIHSAIGCGQVKRSTIGLVANVDVRSPREQRTDNTGVATASGYMEAGPALGQRVLLELIQNAMPEAVRKRFHDGDCSDTSGVEESGGLVQLRHCDFVAELFPPLPRHDTQLPVSVVVPARRNILHNGQELVQACIASQFVETFSHVVRRFDRNNATVVISTLGIRFRRAARAPQSQLRSRKRAAERGRSGQRRCVL